MKDSQDNTVTLDSVVVDPQLALIALARVRACLMRGAFPPMPGQVVKRGAPPADTLPISAFSDQTYLDALVLFQSRRFPAEADRAAIAMLCFYPIVRALVVVPLASLLLSEIALDPDPDRIFVRVSDTGDISGIWFTHSGRTGTFEARCRWIGQRIGVALSQLFPAFQKSTHLGYQLLSGAASMPVANSLNYIGQAIGDERARKVATLVLEVGAPHLRQVDYIEFTDATRRISAVRPLACCLAYRLYGGQNCIGCPRDPEPLRTERQRAWMMTRLNSNCS